MVLLELTVMGLLTYYAISLLVVGVKVLFADPANYERNRARLKGVAATIFGDMNVAPNHGRDDVTACGMAVNRNGLVEPRGRLSDEAIDSIRPN